MPKPIARLTVHPIDGTVSVWIVEYRLYPDEDNKMTGERVETETDYWVPPAGGYVRKTSALSPGTLGEQVCNGLRNRGITLNCTREQLPELIRQQLESRGYEVAFTAKPT